MDTLITYIGKQSFMRTFLLTQSHLDGFRNTQWLMDMTGVTTTLAGFNSLTG